MRVSIAILGLLLVSAIGFLGYEKLSPIGYAGKSKLDMRLAPKVQSIAGQWSLHDLEWKQFDGAWRITTTFVPSRISKFTASHRDLLHSFCGAVLTNLPSKPSSEIARGDVFRVDLNVVLNTGASSEMSQVYSKYMPVPVRDGACLVPKENKFTLFPTYPNELVGWRLEKVNFQKDDGVTVPEVVFFWTDPGKARDEGFDYLLACKAAMADPYVIGSFEELSRIKPDYSLSDASQIRVSARHRYGNKFLNVSKGGAVVFDLVDGECHRARVSEEA